MHVRRRKNGLCRVTWMIAMNYQPFHDLRRVPIGDKVPRITTKIPRMIAKFRVPVEAPRRPAAGASGIGRRPAEAVRRVSTFLQGCVSGRHASGSTRAGATARPSRSLRRPRQRRMDRIAMNRGIFCHNSGATLQPTGGR
jgi:hypothetical protein